MALPSQLLTVLGVIGVGLILAAYAGVQLGRLDARRPWCLAMNLGGSSLILLSMIPAFNLPGALVEAAWAAIALFGLVRWFRGRSR